MSARISSRHGSIARWLEVATAGYDRGMAQFDLRHVTAAVHDSADQWENLGVRWSLTVGSERDGSVASITCETVQVHVHLTVGADGGAEMHVVDRPAHLSSVYRYLLATAEDVTTCLSELTRHIVPPG